jgi:hypothetical protein
MDESDDYFDEDFCDEIVRHRCLDHGTNWRLRDTALTQRGGAISASMHWLLSFYCSMMHLPLFST